MDALTLFVLALVFATFVLTFQGIFFWIQMRREAQDEWLRHRLGLAVEIDTVALSDDDDSVKEIIREQAVDEAISWLGDYNEKFAITLRAAGSEMSVQGLLAQMVLAGVIGTVALISLGGWAGVLAGPLCSALPYMILQSKASTRADAMLSQMPDSLELMARSMQTGTGLGDAFRNVSEEMPEPIAFEFGRVYEEVRFGKEWRDTMQDLIDRNPTLFDLRLFVSSMMLQKESGGNMIETLARISKTIRNRYVFDAKVRAMTSEARTSGFVLAGMPAGVIGLVLVANPEYLRPLVATSLGHIVIIMCLTSYGIGLYLMQTASNVEM
jgi:tight adherence protein B